MTKTWLCSVLSGALRPFFAAVLIILLVACVGGAKVGGPCRYSAAEVVVLELVEIGEDFVIARLVAPDASRLGSSLRQSGELLDVPRPRGMTLQAGAQYRASARFIEEGSCVPRQVRLMGPVVASD